MDDFDNALARIRDLPLDSRLSSIDDPVLDELARRTKGQLSVFVMTLVAALSLGIGIAGSIAPAELVQSASVFPLGAPAALAPSTLLGGR